MATQVAPRLAPYQSDENGNDPLKPPVPYPADNELASDLSRLAGLPSLPLGIPNAGAFGRLPLVS